jgi:membrane protein DedA with SNARE-associated domain
LREATTGDLGLRFESVVFLVAGIVLTAWPELVAEWLPDSLRFRVALAIALGWPALRFWWLWKRSRQDEVLG